MEDMDQEEVLSVLRNWSMEEFCDFVNEKQLDGRKLMEVTEGIVKLWRPKANAKEFIKFIHSLKENPEKYLSNQTTYKKEVIKVTKETNIYPDNQYQTVTVRKTREEVNVNAVEELLKKIVPAKSFLYRNQQKRTEKAVTSYLPMDNGTPKKKRFFRLSAYEYPLFDFRLRFSKGSNDLDRGYYSVKSDNKHFLHKSSKYNENKTKYKSLPTPETAPDYIQDDHLYEDLNYNEIHKVEENDSEEINQKQVTQVKPCMVKIQELFQAFRFPFFRKSEEIIEKEIKSEKEQQEGNIYENNDSVADMYDSIHVPNEFQKTELTPGNRTLPVEDYLEPVQLNKDYCDVTIKHKEESLLGFIMSYFENRFGIRRETNDGVHSEESESESRDDDKWSSGKVGSMAARPLPVPVENEPYFMEVDRAEAENLLRGQPDGTFVLRPSSQPNHAYTLSVACSGEVHNVGVRRRADGRLALGFARRGERSFVTVTSLLRHHRRRRLLLVAAGDVIGATTLNEPPHYYQTPSNIPVIHI